MKPSFVKNFLRFDILTLVLIVFTLLPVTVAANDSSDNSNVKVLRFKWCPSSKAKNAYEMSNPNDQHRIVFTKGVTSGGSYPVVVAFHGQPKRGKNPRDYMFMEPVQRLVTQMVEKGEIKPVILVIPVFRFVGENWPWMNPKKLKDKVKEILDDHNIKATDWYVFGHSGAAGCGGAGLNQAHRMKPKAVGFFDTCLGKGWRQELSYLRKAHIKTVNIHSVETAGFKPRQRPEYQSGFNFGRAYKPEGLKPIKCPSTHPGLKLRTQKFKCAATDDKIIHAFIVDSGEGQEAHMALIKPAVRYFLVHFANLNVK